MKDCVEGVMAGLWNLMIFKINQGMTPLGTSVRVFPERSK